MLLKKVHDSIRQMFLFTQLLKVYSYLLFVHFTVCGLFVSWCVGVRSRGSSALGDIFYYALYQNMDLVARVQNKKIPRNRNSTQISLININNAAC